MIVQLSIQERGRMQLFILTLTAALAALTAAAPAVPATHVLHEKREYLPRKWVKRELVERNTMLPMRIGMTQRNLDIGEELLMEM